MLRRLSIIAALCFAAPAVAQDATADPDTAASNRDTLTIGVGAAIAPRYEGSDDYRVIPVGAIRGKVSGISFSTVGTGVFTDIIPSGASNEWKFVLGPVAHLTLNRSSLKTTRDPQIVALGKIPVAVELGGHAGFSKTGVITSAYDNFTVDVAVTHDVTGVHDGLIVTPSVNYGTPLSRKVFVGISASGTYVGRGYAQRYFGIDNRQFLASGLSTYPIGKGFKDVSVGALANFSLTGDLRKGLSLFIIGNGSRLLGDFARSPVVRDRMQYFGGAGLAFTF
jgi:MipA family protein